MYTCGTNVLKLVDNPAWTLIQDSIFLVFIYDYCCTLTKHLTGYLVVNVH